MSFIWFVSFYPRTSVPQADNHIRRLLQKYIVSPFRDDVFKSILPFRVFLACTAKHDEYCKLLCVKHFLNLKKITI